MSRSFKRTPVAKESGDRKFSKRRANKAVRRETLLTGKSNKYRLVVDSWEIYDYRFYENKPHLCNKDELEFWKKHYYRK